MVTFYGGMRELADHRRPRVRLRIDADTVRLGPWIPGAGRGIPSYVIPWSQVERVEAVPDLYRSGPGVRFVLRAPSPAQLGQPNAGRFVDAKAPVFMCGTLRRMQRVLLAVPGNLVAAPA